jgi:hypothetical protein
MPRHNQIVRAAPEPLAAVAGDDLDNAVDDGPLLNVREVGRGAAWGPCGLSFCVAVNVEPTARLFDAVADLLDAEAEGHGRRRKR